VGLLLIAVIVTHWIREDWDGSVESDYPIMVALQCTYLK